MPKDLQNLIRLNEWEVDEKRRKLGELLRLMANLEAQAKALEEELVREQHKAGENPVEGGLLYGAYAETVIERRERIKDSIEKMEEAITEAREELRVAYLELKKYEIAQENRDKKMAREAARRETMEYDEVGLQSYRQANGTRK
ncbi:MAG: flagellar export protein FliJ [Rhodospirillales bacterium]